MAFLPRVDLDVVKLRAIELFTSNTPRTSVPSYSDIGKSFSLGGFLLFLLTGFDWLLLQLANAPGLGWWGVAISALAFLLHHLLLFFQHGSEAKVDAIKQAVEQAQTKNDPPDDNPPPPPPLRIVG